MKIRPEDDGKTHINIFSRGKGLGKLLSNFTYTPFIHPHYGKFLCVEGLWYYLGLEGHPRREELRDAVGKVAKDLGRELRAGAEPAHVTNFKREIILAFVSKLEQIPTLLEMLRNSELPFEYYYVFGDPKNPVVRHDTKNRWVVEAWETLRQLAKAGLPLRNALPAQEELPFSDPEVIDSFGI